jgi:hypothetical protein
MKRWNRKAQLTLYIIIGIIILLAAFLIIYFTYGARKAEVERAIPEVSTLPLGYRTAELYITDCLELTAETALREMGAHGGYISIYDPNKYDSEKDFNINVFEPVNSDVVPMDKMGQNLVPYWWHVKTPYGCGAEEPCFATQENIPTIEEMELQLNAYIEQNLPECLQEFKDLRAQGFEIREMEEDGMKVTSKILLENVIFYLDYPLEIKKGAEEVEAKTFTKSLDLNFRQIYNQAFTISFDEMNGQRLENSVMLNLISVYSGAEFDRLPPIAATTAGYDIVMWPKVLVEMKVKDLLKLYIPFIKINGTANAKQITDPDPVVQGVFSSLLFNMFENYTFPDTDINYYFLDWPIEFHITPPAGAGVLKPKSYKTEYPFGLWQPSQRNFYEFFYDVSFPVVIEIYDKSAFGGKGYSFFFALEGNILDNRNLLDWNHGMGTVDWDQSAFNMEINPDASGTVELTELEGIEELEDINMSTEFEIEVETPTHVKSLFDRFEQRISNITIYTKDKKTDEFISEVSVELICGKYKAASLGSTELLPSGKRGLITQAPICYGDGRLRFDKLNYDTLTLGPITTAIDGNQVITAELEPIRKQEVSLRKVARFVPSGENATIIDFDPHQPLQFYENAIVVMQKEQVSPYDSRLTVAANFETPDNQFIEIPPGEYSVMIILMDSRNMTIPEEIRTYGSDDEEVEVTIPEMSFEDGLMSGGLEYNNGTCGTVTIHDYLLDENNVLELRALLLKRPFVKVEEVSEIGRISEYTNMSCVKLRPTFIS